MFLHNMKKRKNTANGLECFCRRERKKREENNFIIKKVDMSLVILVPREKRVIR